MSTTRARARTGRCRRSRRRGKNTAVAPTASTSRNRAAGLTVLEEDRQTKRKYSAARTETDAFCQTACRGAPQAGTLFLRYLGIAYHLVESSILERGCSGTGGPRRCALVSSLFVYSNIFEGFVKCEGGRSQGNQFSRRLWGRALAAFAKSLDIIKIVCYNPSTNQNLGVIKWTDR